MDYPVKKGQQLTAEILRAGDAGDGVALVGGMTVFVEKTLPGETAEVVITDVQAKYAKARVVKLVKASEKRIQPPCPYEKLCGGCSMQFMDYDTHCALLQNHVSGLMQRVGGQTDYELLPILRADGADACRMTEKHRAFFANAGLLHEKFGIVPLMYGSLGLEYITGEELHADDVDVLIPKAYIAERWDEFASFLAQQGYVLIDENEHEFEKDGIRYAYAQIEELKPFAGISLTDIAVCSEGGVSFKLLSLEQYLKVYNASSKDGYRVNVRQKKDAEKIALIESHLEKKRGAQPWRYRNTAVFRAGGTKDMPQLGFVGKGTHNLVPATDCLLQTGEACIAAKTVLDWMRQNAIAPYDERTRRGVLRHLMVRTNKQGQVMVVPVTAGEQLPAKQQLIDSLKNALPGLISIVQNINSKPGQQILGYKCRVLYGQERLEDELMGLKFRLSALSFYQINRRQTERLYGQALEFAALTGKETVADAYCGAGTISLCMAKSAKRVIGVEIVPEAIADAKENAARNGVHNAEFIVGACEDVLPKLVSEGLKPDVVMLDPPRKGCEEAVLTAAAQTHPQRIVYVSCNPATLARDAKRLAAMGYSMKKLRVCDMFSWTGEAECVALFEKADA